MSILLVILGLYVILPKLLHIFISMKKLLCIPKENLKEKFESVNSSEKAPWVVITGCTSGIGEELSYRMGKQGFNLVLISRNINKLIEVERNVKALNGKGSTKLIVADFAKDGISSKLY